MSVEFLKAKCQKASSSKRFGLCDRPHPSMEPAYLDESEGGEWIATVQNMHEEHITFTAIDHCIEIKNEDGKMAKRCDGMLTFGNTVIFVELKERKISRSDWIEEGEVQLLSTIEHFEKTDEAKSLTIKRAYIANKLAPKFKSSHLNRMEQFAEKTKYVLRIMARIEIDMPGGI